ncbi:MAG: VTT domain-containing protein [Candidatus Diapherotrites archaeon]|uniref:VTT domain-containing protein n=1 Tax=Candidatus Iainarchaeum sp. TaxID=3101447 RepID=A0A8T3YMK3_9ARCH|nr:VTT domain-containing protein [Candidatus Diapherotrites archaeon]
MEKNLQERIAEKLAALAPIVAFLLFVYLIITNIGLLREVATGYGLIGMFAAAILANATVLLPVPLDLAIVAINAEQSSLAQAITVAIVVGAGAAIGEMTAYYAGLLGIQTAEKLRKEEFARIKEFREKLEKMGASFVFLGALLPLPFDIIGITAGFIRFNPRKFFIAAFFGKIGRYIALSLLAYYGYGLAKSLGII